MRYKITIFSYVSLFTGIISRIKHHSPSLICPFADLLVSQEINFCVIFYAPDVFIYAYPPQKCQEISLEII